MLRALWSSASGMVAQQTNLDVVANNLANVSTAGYKKRRADFQDLLYQVDRQPGTPVAPDSSIPAGVQVGLGSRVVGTPSMMTVGDMQVTEAPLDWAISGKEGFFQVTMADGTIGYTRAGAWQVDADGQIVNHNGLLLEPAMVVPDDAVEVMLSTDGVVSVKLAEETEAVEIGQLELARFVNPGGLLAAGDNVFLETDASGEAIIATPGTDGMSEVRQGLLEMSNVQVVEEMVSMIIAQRAYEANSKGIQTADELLRIANAMKR